MYMAIGRIGQRGPRPGCQRILGSLNLSRRFKLASVQPLDLPALDKKWRLEWQRRRLEKQLLEADEDQALKDHVARETEVLRSVVKNPERLPRKDGYDEKKLDNLTRIHFEYLRSLQRSRRSNGKGKKYVLPMFPYPSGNLHLGHLRVYTISDVLARFHRMQGHLVLHPIGWDAFGLPAENAAIERGIAPGKWTKQNIQKMKSQLEAMNGEWDWDREFATCDPTFYKHTQTLFSELHKAGLAYQAESLVNYDPVDKTVLANEQVDSKGCSWRSGAKVEKRMLKQWFFKISEYRQELIDGLEELQKHGAWPERVLSMQKNWVGKSTGARIKFSVEAYDKQIQSDIEVFTTRPDTLFGVQYLALASSHPIVQALAKTDTELQSFLDTMPYLPQDTKAGYLLPIRAMNPLAYEESMSDATKAPLPVYVAPYVLGDYGDGAVMGVPGHDTRDHCFWKHNRLDDPVRFVISQTPDEANSIEQTGPFVHHGYLTKTCGQYAGLTTAEATKTIVSLLKSKKLGEEAETWRLRDWLVSRQRYWGTPIPIIHCTSCGPVLVPEHDLPVELPPVESHWEIGKTGNPLEHAHDWINVPCPKCGEAAKRDTDTMDTFVDSSWYFMRFPDSKNCKLPFDPCTAHMNLPVDLYIGGVEHAILHLLYSRFIYKFFTTTRLWHKDSPQLGEPFKKFLAQGMVHGKTYSDPSTGRFLKPEEVDLTNPSKPIVVASNEVANVSFEKMSKSKYNGVDPGVCMAKYGADATRAHILFQAPVSEILEWDEEKISGVTRWLRRLHEMIVKSSWDEQCIVFDPNNPIDEEFSPKLYFLMTDKNSIGPESEFWDGAELSELYNPGSRRTKGAFSTLSNANASPRDTPSQERQACLAKKEAEALDRLSYLRTRQIELDKKFWREVQATISTVTDSYAKTHSLNTVVSDLMALTNTIIEYDDSRVDTKNGITIRAKKNLVLHATRLLLQMMAPITPAFSEECWEIVKPPPHSTWWNSPPRKIPLYPLSSPVLTFAQLFEIPISQSWSHIKAFFNTNFNLSQRFNPNNNADSIFSANQIRNQKSIFDTPFPEQDGTYDLLAPSTQVCVVQVNGKMRCAVTIPIPDTSLEGEELEQWLREEILQSDEGTGLKGERKSGNAIEKGGNPKGKGKKVVDIRKARKVIVVKGGKTVNFVM
ncbi:related to leucine--tRNA ligase precursor, mitochondrial [Rhynchosporium agropyri]|uniref:leucine--tRNA ligase n=1 Tax=Rhynchosporium agropyri TaxID=914238 RepID=A0A1E1LI38_9HELO|nr:related to leucine--tRNA ligase precursor, mitochondrial [Rhynchosporium agropyri]